jgi:hypothetical protein
MQKYMIEYQTKINGGTIRAYHEKIGINDNSETMNVYVEYLTLDVKTAMVFHDREEAVKISKLFETKYTIPDIVTIK